MRQHADTVAGNPNDDLLQIGYGRYLMYVDRPEDGLRRIREAMLHLLGRHAEALATFRHITSPVFYHFAYMAACHHALGENEAAAEMKARSFIARPDSDVSRFVSALPHRSTQTAEWFARDLDWTKIADDAVRPSIYE